MKKLLLLNLLTMAVYSHPCIAQTIDNNAIPEGNAKLVVGKVDGKPETYVFPNDLTVGYNCIVHNNGESIPDRTTEIIFMRTFEKGGKQTDVSVNLHIEPNSIGNFPLDPDVLDKPLPSGSISIDFNNTEGPFLGQDPSKGTSGSITITQYPAAAGSYITGTFKAILNDENGNHYYVSGEFRVKRVNQ
ncbi:MAG TPA: hypothetical protein VFI29_11265 [Hanamia sp.]|nr:hypothetical protein [Hanamia sp.]